MEVGKWYTSTWFIAVLFVLWFLVVPLFIGIYLLTLQNKESSARKIYFESITSQKKALQEQEIELIKQQEKLEDERLSKEKEIEELETAHQLRLDLLTKEIELKLIEEQRELDKLEIDHQQRLDLLTKDREDELNFREASAESKEKDLEIILLEKQKEFERMEAVHQQKLIQLTSNREDELAARENVLNMLEEKVTERESDSKRLDHEIKRAEQRISVLKSQIITLDDELLYQSFGFYETRYDMENSDEYKHFLDKVRIEQKKLVKEKRAVNLYYDEIDESIMKKHVQLVIRSFNNDCDSLISKVKFNNIEVSEKKIRTSFHYINELNQHNYIELAEEFLSLKLEELFLAYEYSQRKQEEREEQRRINERIREDGKAQKELEEQLKVLRKEEQHLENAMKHSSQFSEQRTDEIRFRLEQIQRQKEDVDYRIKNTKAGYVYVISNIGSFGENVYKIGMTRRLEPMDRVRELGGASVPFRYDVHAVIFSDNAPELEASLHRTFTHRRINKVNERKEFFKVTLKEIKKVVQKSHIAVIEFTMAAEAQEYRETLQLEKQYDEQISV